MSSQGIYSRIVAWFRGRWSGEQGEPENYRLNDDGLLDDSFPVSPDSADKSEVKRIAVPSTTLAGRDKPQSLEKFQVSFDRLIEELSTINDHLRKQVTQHDTLITRIDLLPKLLEDFPAAVENQKVLTDGLIEQLKSNLLRDKQIIETIEKIPVEAAKQTDTLESIDRQLSAAADIDVQMTETMNKFNQSMERLNHSTQEHTEGISQMSRTFAASDRYLKFIVSRQSRQFMWVFYSALTVCAIVILILVGLIIYLAR
jgi:hypothetical protein